jgi:beta-phosphoglucomutase-like phosphatase (HAD superfamily)
MSWLKLIIFDMDGVLIESKQLHYESLNMALGERYAISPEEQASTYEGLPTKMKLELLTKNKQLPRELHAEIWAKKQEHSQQLLSSLVKPDARVTEVLKHFFDKGIELRCCSNSIGKTCNLVLELMEIKSFFTKVHSNDDPEFVHRFPKAKSKPHSSMYTYICLDSGFNPQEVLACEDSDVGRRAVMNAGCRLCPIANVDSLKIEWIEKHIHHYSSSPCPVVPWILTPEMNVLIPASGRGVRFHKTHGQYIIKPLISAHPEKFGCKPLIQLVVENLQVQARWTFVVLDEHNDRFNLSYWLPTLVSRSQQTNEKKESCEVIVQNGPREGAAVTTLLAKDRINNDQPLLIANSDQYFECESFHTFLYRSLCQDDIDGGILTFEMKSSDDNERNKWSYAKLHDSTGFVSEIAEKRPISKHATCGIYCWKKGADYVKYAEQMIQDKQQKINNEWYVAPTYNLAIREGKNFIIHDVDRFWGLGIPTDLSYFQTHF